MRRKEEWLNKLNKKEMSSKEFLLSKSYKENKNLKLKETDKLYFINMLQKFVNKFNLKKKKPSNKEQNILKKEENLNKKCQQKKSCYSKLRAKNSKSCITKEFQRSIALN